MLVLILVITDFTLSDELEKGLSVLQVNLLRILNLSWSTGVIWPPPKTYLSRWQNPLTLGYRTLKFPCTLQKRVDLSLSIMLKKLFSSSKNMQKKIIEYFQNCLKVSFCTWSFLRPCLRACYPSTELAKKARKKKKKKTIVRQAITPGPRL